MAKSYMEMFNEAYGEYRKLAKRANQRMVRLEQGVEAGRMPKGLTGSSWAYGQAQTHLQRLRANFTGKQRFTENFRPKNEMQAKEALKSIEAQRGAVELFINSVTSSWGATTDVKGKRQHGYKESIKMATDTLNTAPSSAGYNRNIYQFSSEDRAMFYKSKAFNQIKDRFTSEQVVQVARYVFKARDTDKEFRNFVKRKTNYSRSENIEKYNERVLDAIDDAELQALLEVVFNDGIEAKDFFREDIR